MILLDNIISEIPKEAPLNFAEAIGDVDPRLLTIPEGRRAVTKNDPLLFALVYLPHHLRDGSDDITLSEFHMDLIEYGKSWLAPVDDPKHARDAFIAPRGSGKSTWLFLILPTWAAAHGHVKFIAAYSDSASQAQGHLLSFKTELLNNDLLREDFPDLCATERGVTGRALADNNFKSVRENGFVFTASGVDVSNHGLKHGNQRPQVIILDDIEPGESNYSNYQMVQRRNTIWDDIVPQGAKQSRVVIVGTTTMSNSIIDQLRKFGELSGLSTYAERSTTDFDIEAPEYLQWVKDQRVKVHYYPGILTDNDGNERSLWQEKWPIEWLQGQRHLRDFAKNFLNKPMAMDGRYWDTSDITIKESDYGNTILSIDPAVTTAKTSDYTGIAVVSRGEGGVYVRYANQVKMTPQSLRNYAAELIEQFGVGVIYVETNQGGDLWREVFAGMPCRFRAVRQSIKKEIRAEKALNYYQQGLVFHADKFYALEEQLLSFPAVTHDDILDAVVSGVLYFLDRPRGTPVRAKQVSWTGS